MTCKRFKLQVGNSQLWLDVYRISLLPNMGYVAYNPPTLNQILGAGRRMIVSFASGDTLFSLLKFSYFILMSALPDGVNHSK